MKPEIHQTQGERASCCLSRHGGRQHSAVSSRHSRSSWHLGNGSSAVSDPAGASCHAHHSLLAFPPPVDPPPSSFPASHANLDASRRDFPAGRRWTTIHVAPGGDDRWSGALTHLERVAQGVDPATGQTVPMENRAFIARGEDLEPLKGLSPDQLHDVNVVVLHSWEVSRHRIAAVDHKTGKVILTGPAPWAFFAWGPNQRYYFENVPGTTDRPGEWSLIDKITTERCMPSTVVT